MYSILILFSVLTTTNKVPQVKHERYKLKETAPVHFEIKGDAERQKQSKDALNSEKIRGNRYSTLSHKSFACMKLTKQHITVNPI